VLLLYIVFSFWNGLAKEKRQTNKKDLDIHLKMLGLYLYTLIIGHQSCNMLSILLKYHCKRNCEILWQLMCFGTKSKNTTTTTKQKKLNIKTLTGAGNWTRDLLHPKRMRYHCTTDSTENLSIVVKLFNCFDAMGRNVNKQSRICGPHIFNKCIFCNILTCMNNHIWQFLILTGVGFTA